MSTFWIFAACLTLAYAIYYTVVICMDIYGKPKDQRLTSVETFSIDDIVPEASIAVEKTEDGYRIGKATSQPDEEPQWEEKPIVPSIKILPEVRIHWASGWISMHKCVLADSNIKQSKAWLCISVKHGETR